MAKRSASPTEDRLGTEASAVLEAARRNLDGVGKKARRRFERLERRIATAVKAEAKRRGQLDETRAELASLVGRVAELVRPATDPMAEEAMPSAAPAAKPAAAKPAAAKPAAAKPAAAKTTRKAAPTVPTARRRSLRPAARPTGSPDS